MAFTFPLVFNGLVLSAPTAIEKQAETYVFGGNNLGSCPSGYRPIRDAPTCQLALQGLQNDPVGHGLVSHDPFSYSSSNDPPGCFQFSWEGGGATQNQLYFNQNLKAAPPQSHINGRHYACVQEEFGSFNGQWNWVGQNLASTTEASTISWSKTDSSSTTDSFTWGLTQSVGAGFGPVKVSVGASQSWSDSVTASVAHMQGGSQSYDCKAVSCTNGNLYQWAIVGKAIPGYSDQINTECSFVCIDNSNSRKVVPKCPAGWCGDEGCQCCNGDEWAENGEEVTVCSNALESNCIGCD